MKDSLPYEDRFPSVLGDVPSEGGLYCNVLKCRCLPIKQTMTHFQLAFLCLRLLILAGMSNSSLNL